MSKRDEQDIYYIPPNFIDSGTVLGGMIKLRNAIEAAVLAAAFGIPICMLTLSLTAKVIILCMTVLPVGILALIGFSGESLFSFIYTFFKFLRNRRIIEKKTEQPKEDNPIRETENPIETDCYRW